jgi:glycosyltransferase involved in cell wall biosynthesis
VTADAAFARPPRITGDPVPGVNLAGFLEGHLGLGEVARKLEQALEHAGVPFASIPYRRSPNARREPLRRQPAAVAPYDTNIICLNADYLHTFAGDIGVEFFASRYSIGVWFWETSVFRNENVEAFRFLDEVWVASEYVRRSVSAQAEIPVYVAPLPMEEPLPPTLTRSDLALPDAYTFLFTFDFVSAVRKNPNAVVDAFTRAFEPGEGPVLVLKTINGRERKPRLLAELEEAVGDRPDIRVRDAYVSVETKNAITAACDCFVSLHRSEGFGLTMAEAMSYGKPVIATGYSGNTDFMDERTSYLVPYRLVPVPSDWWAHAPAAQWAEPDVDAAAVLMRHVYEHQDEARARGRRARDALLERFSLERTSAFVSSRLDETRSRGAVGARLSAHDPRPAILEASQELAKGVGEGLVERGGSRPTSLVRRLLHRALWPYLEDQQRFERSVLDSLSALHRSQDELGRRLADLEARPSPESLRPYGGEESASGDRERADA